MRIMTILDVSVRAMPDPNAVARSRWRRGRWQQATLTLLMTFAVACGTDDGGPIGTGECALEPTFTSIYTNRLRTQTCASGGCHDAVSVGGGLNFEQPPAEVLADLVGIASPNQASKVRVVAGDASQSYFHEKLASDDPGGPLGRMPPTGNPLDQCEIDAVADWINAGALND